MTDKSWHEPDVDALLSGRHPRDPQFAQLAPFVASIRAGLDRPVSEAEISAAGPRLALAAREALRDAPRARRVWARRIAFTGVAAAALGFGVVGAAAADPAAPGDALYGLDRALEAVGINDGGLGERLDEANELVDEGDADGAIDLIADALEDEGDEEGKAALLAVAETLQQNGSQQSADVHAAVAAMLTWMATTDATGKEFGQGVAEHARAIHGAPDANPGGGKPDNLPAKPSPSAKPEKPDNPADNGAGGGDNQGGDNQGGAGTDNGSGGGKPDDGSGETGGSGGNPNGGSDSGKGKPETTPAPPSGKGKP